MNAAQFFIDQKIRQSVSSLHQAQSSISRTQSVVELVRLMNEVHTDHLVKSLSIVRQEAYRFRVSAERHADTLVAKLIAALPTDPKAVRQAQSAYRECCGTFPRQADALRRALAGLPRPEALAPSL